MKKLLLTALMAVAASLFGLQAQIVTSAPSPLQQDSQDVVIYYHADMGNKGLNNQPASSPIYAHTGVITSESASDGDWKHAPTWKDNDAKYKLEYVSPNLWKLNIGSIDSYYGLNPGEKVVKLAFVFRNADASKEGKTAAGGDIFLDVMEEGLQLSLSSSLESNVVMEATKVTFTANTTVDADITISVNGEQIAANTSAKTLTADYTLQQAGTYTVSAEATANGETVSAVEVFSYISPSDQKTYPGGVPKMGTVRNDDGTVTFCLAAPLKKTVTLVGSWDDYNVLVENTMHYQDYNGYRYFWITVPGLERNKQYMYYFLVDGTKGVGDPYAKLVLDPYNDKYISPSVYPDLPAYPTYKVEGVPLAVFQDNLNDYEWTDNDFQGAKQTDLVIYELLLRDFTGTEGQAKGDGTVRQAITKIPYLAHLGINAVELLPINEFNGNISWGYNPNFYFAPDKAYGDPKAYKDFINTCHANGIAVILDMVFNQTDWLHPWYQMYSVGSNPFFNADAPHAYSVLNDWNQGNPIVQQQFKDVLKYWAEEYHIDGYRFDLVKGLGDNNSYANNGDAATNAYNASRVARMKELQTALLEVKPDAYFINENLAGAKEENEMAATFQLNWANINTEGRQYAMGYSDNSGLNRMYAPNDGSRLCGSTVSYLESHDEERLAYAQKQYGVSGIKGNTANSMRRLSAAAAQMILAPGAHMIWQFSELGNDQSTKASNGSNDTDPKKVLWSYYEQPDRRGLYDCYCDLIHIRRNNPELFDIQDHSLLSSLTMNCSASDWSRGRLIVNTSGAKELVTVINPTLNDIAYKYAFSVKDSSKYRIMSKSYDTNPTFNAATGIVTIPANSYVTIGTIDLVGVEELAAEAVETGVPAYAENGRIVLCGDKAAEVHAIDGRLVFRGTGSVQVPAGIYVVTLDGRSLKLLVK